MTFKELFEQEKKHSMTQHDMYTNCPGKLGYEKTDHEKCRSTMNCETCWNREAYPEHMNKDVEAVKEMVASRKQVAKHKLLCEELNRTYEAKNHDYGDSFHRSYIEDGLLMAKIRIGDKYSRFKSLLENADQKVKDESIRDTLMDMANYCIMTVMELEE